MTCRSDASTGVEVREEYLRHYLAQTVDSELPKKPFAIAVYGVHRDAKPLGDNGNRFIVKGDLNYLRFARREMKLLNDSRPLFRRKKIRWPVGVLWLERTMTCQRRIGGRSTVRDEGRDMD